MIAALCLKAVTEFLKQELNEYAAAQGITGAYVIPKVYEWALPFKNPKLPQPDQAEFPYVVVRPKGGEDGEKESTLNMDVLFGVYREAEQGPDGLYRPDGYHDLLALMEHVRVILQRKRVIDGKYELLRPYKWEIPPEQPFPYWEGWAETKWQLAAIVSQEEEAYVHE